jgi:LytS/YehU family sensor histidine kinase
MEASFNESALYLAQGEDTLLFFLLVVASFLAIRFFLQLSNANETNRQLQIYLDSANNEIKSLSQEKKRLNEEERKLKEEIHQRKIENLRFALNPHSFKNTLNSIQTLAANTYESVRGLSATIDYMLYDGQQPFVLLEQELDFARQYLVLFQKKLRPSFNLTIELDLSHRPDFCKKFCIAPLITAGFIENAFQHGDTESNDGFILVKMEIVSSNSIVYMVKNRIRPIQHRGKGGLGKAKMQERLELLYPSRHSIEYKNDNGIFIAILKLELHEGASTMHTG